MAEEEKKNRWRTLILVGGLVLVGLLGLGIFLTYRSARAAPTQPIAFDHEKHDQAGVPCLFCHSSPARSDVAGIPSMALCMGCHNSIATERGEIQKLTDYWERGEPIPWQRVVDMPDHVYFSHQPHILKGIACETCHGEVGQMTVVRPVGNMDMGWCLGCHVDQPKEKVARLADCLACHK
jgi:hypothetical protein